MASEIDAVHARYSRRCAQIDSDFYSLVSPVNLHFLHERQRHILRFLSGHGFADLGSVRLLEVGAGTGNNLLEFLRMGFAPENLLGVELLLNRARIARRVLPPSLKFIHGDASSLVVEKSSLDLVFQSVVFSSLLDRDFQQMLAQRMWSWVRPGGAVLWYDFTYDNPRNPDVRGVPLSRIRQLFPYADIDARRLTLAPPLARRLCRINPSLYSLFNLTPLLRTHLLCWVKKQP